MEKKIRIYTAEHCSPCRQLEEHINNGKLDGQEVELVDIETDEGFKLFQEEVLSKAEEDIGVPIAYFEGQKCQLGFDEDRKLRLVCPGDSDNGESKPNTGADKPEA